MQHIDSIATWQKIRKNLDSDLNIGFVPTMGALHEGHASLINRAKRENNIVVLSLFVNPTQFNDPEDYKNYPQTLSMDKVIAEQEGVDYLIVPTAQDIYPQGSLFSIETQHSLSEMFEGAHRPGHFSSVLTVVMKLFQIVMPIRAYFGEKDYQQAKLIQAMAEEFFLDLSVIICPTIREKSGLPLSSRNKRLSNDEKVLAAQASSLFSEITIENTSEIKNKLIQLGLQIDYLDIYDDRAFFASSIGKIRLIDNRKILKQIRSNERNLPDK